VNKVIDIQPFFSHTVEHYYLERMLSITRSYLIH